MTEPKPDPRRTEWTQAIYEMLMDGEWHLQKEVLAEGMKRVPPAVGFRRGEWNRKIHYKKRGNPDDFVLGVRTRGDREDSIRVGSRLIVLNAVKQMNRAGRVEYRGTGDERWLRLSDTTRNRELERIKKLNEPAPKRGKQHRTPKIPAGQVESGTESQPGFFVAPGQNGKLKFGLNLPERRWELRDAKGEVLQTFDTLDPDDVRYWTAYARNSK